MKTTGSPNVIEEFAWKIELRIPIKKKMNSNKEDKMLPGVVCCLSVKV